MLRVENLTKRFEGLVAVNELDFNVIKGEILAIIGPNGAGKSTVFNLITGTLKPSSGRIYMEDRDITGLKPYQVSSMGLARTFQTTSLFDQLRVIDNMLIGYKYRTQLGFWNTLLHTPKWRAHQQEAFERAMETLNFLGLAQKSEQFVPALSQEEQKRLAIGIALVSKPKILLLDEPTGGLIQEETERVTQLIRSIREQGTTVCIIEHKMQMIMGLVDRIVVLNYGEKIAEGPPAEVKSDQTVINAYLGEEVDA
ncbi:MAG: ABC transporter ATP-binding protein [Desulfobacterales bacterium]